MRIVTWNARMKFREKFELVRQLGADIYVIQECEDPERYEGRTRREREQGEAYRAFAANHLWWGGNKSRGVGVFAAPHITLADHCWEDVGRWYAGARINDSFDLVAVWCNPEKKKGKTNQSYGKENVAAVERLAASGRIGEDSLLIGDFVSCRRWDAQYGTSYYTQFAGQLQALGLVSAYHHGSGEQPGEESQPSRRRCDPHSGLYREAYHIDLAFVAPSRIRACRLELSSDYHPERSDHRPLILDID